MAMFKIPLRRITGKASKVGQGGITPLIQEVDRSASLRSEDVELEQRGRGRAMRPPLAGVENNGKAQGRKVSGGGRLKGGAFSGEDTGS